jgi:hypothetical protein
MKHYLKRAKENWGEGGKIYSSLFYLGNTLIKKYSAQLNHEVSKVFLLLAAFLSRSRLTGALTLLATFRLTSLLAFPRIIKRWVFSAGNHTVKKYNYGINAQLERVYTLLSDWKEGFAALLARINFPLAAVHNRMVLFTPPFIRQHLGLELIPVTPIEITSPPAIIIERETFHSSFRAWIRVVAFIIVAVFLPEQVAQAVEYDWRVLWNQPNASAGPTPAVLANPRQQDIPLAIKNLLKDISRQPVTEIKISPTVSIELEKPVKLSNQRIEEIYHWLIGKPCGAKALYDYLSYTGSAAQEQDIAVVALTADIVNGVVKPEGNPEVIKNSLYALAKAAEFFGQKLFAVKFDIRGQSPAGTVPLTFDTNLRTKELTNALTPFIAHLNSDHYILVTGITEDKVYFSDNHQEDFLPQDKFNQEFSGYALVSFERLPERGYELLDDAAAKKILGARKSRRERGLDYFGMAAGGLLMAGGSLSGQSLLTAVKNYGLSYGAPKLLRMAGLDRTTSHIGGAFLAGSLSSGFDYGWKNFRPMLSQGLTRATVEGIQEIGYRNKWDTKLFPGATHLASTIGGDFAQVAFNKALSVQFGTAKSKLVFDESRLASTWRRGDKQFKYVQGIGMDSRLLSNYEFSADKMVIGSGYAAFRDKLLSYGAEGVRLFAEDKASTYIKKVMPGRDALSSAKQTGFSRAMGALEFCASCTILTICARAVSLPTFMARNLNAPVLFNVAPMTSSPFFLETGSDSPVSMDSSTAELPSTMTPSTGTFSPGRT